MTLSNPVAPLQFSPNEIRFYRENGYLLIPGVVSRETADQISDEVFDIMEASGRTRDDLCAASGAQGQIGAVATVS